MQTKNSRKKQQNSTPPPYHDCKGEKCGADLSILKKDCPAVPGNTFTNMI